MKQYEWPKKRDQLKFVFAKVLRDSFGFLRGLGILDLLSLVGLVVINYGTVALGLDKKAISSHLFDAKT